MESKKNSQPSNDFEHSFFFLRNLENFRFYPVFNRDDVVRKLLRSWENPLKTQGVPEIPVEIPEKAGRVAKLRWLVAHEKIREALEVDVYPVK